MFFQDKLQLIFLHKIAQMCIFVQNLNIVMSTIETRELLIKVARKLFSKEGIGNITMNDIAKAANKSRRTVYTYFQSKEELLEASIEMEVMKISNAMTKVHCSLFFTASSTKWIIYLDTRE